MQNIIWDDLKFFLGRLKAFPVSKSLTLSNKSFCVSTGCSFESWVCYPEKLRADRDVKSVIEFFALNNISFMWPLYDDDDASLLEASGLLYAGRLEAMALQPSRAVTDKVNHSVSFRQATTPELALEWTKTAWGAFYSGSELNDDGVPENYCALVNAFMNDPNFSLYIAELDNQPAGTFIITHEKSLTGVYYFATLPELRRRGIAASMMNEICRLAGNKTITLQATPVGVPFYKSFGFDDLFAIKVYSTEPDIF